MNGLGGGKISGAEINSIGVERIWDCDGEVGRAGEWKNEAFLRCDFLSFRTSANPSTSFCSLPPPNATLSLTNPYSFEISVHVVEQGTNNFSSYPCHLPRVIHNQTLDLQSLSPFPKNVKSRILVYITNYSLQPLLSSTRESDHPIQAWFRCFAL